MQSIPTRVFDAFFEPSPFARQPLRQAITAACRLPEPQIIPQIVASARLPEDMAARVHEVATRLSTTLRARKAGTGRAGLVQNLLQEYSLSSQEGIALMCLAEALLRIPDKATRDALIRDKISNGQWHSHLGRSPSLFVNAATWGLLITGKLVATHSEGGLSSSLGRLVGAGGEPLIRKGVDLAMRMMGEQFVTGETIEEALAHAAVREAEGFRYSFDMLGEAALTTRDAQKYLRDYEDAIEAIGRASAGRGIFEGPGISIKLSALHPRYSRAQYDRVMGELYPVLVRLCAMAKRHDIGLNIDAEEADRLELSLDLLERLSFEPQLQGWNGLGFVVQAYQKRCPFVIDYVVDLARRAGRRLMIRLVKGAYWDSEIKRAQLDGLDGYPVYTRKPYTDAAYIACARKLLAAPEAVYPQFATHNAQTVATIHQLAGPEKYFVHQYEFQCLHGMGEPLYEQIVGQAEVQERAERLGRPCRIYAPVGTHETLLAYLVRRLLENGANTSFVNRIADQAIGIETLVQDPVDTIEGFAAAEGALGLPHPAIPLPCDIYGGAEKAARTTSRMNSRGMDLSSEATLRELAATCAGSMAGRLQALPMTAAQAVGGDVVDVINPAVAGDTVGSVQHASPADVEAALGAAADAAAVWAATSAHARAAMLDTASSLLEERTAHLVALLIREAGKSAQNAIAEVREAVDFLRFYAQEVRDSFLPETHQALGPVVCISPWNFPLAIFIGQVSAALAAGNVVLAKPAEQTPLVAAEAVKALWDAGIPHAAVQLLPGEGSVVGAQLVGDERVMGVLFTGSTEVARILQKATAGRSAANGRAIPLIAETGGQNAMIVDSSALAEQVVADVVASAFDSAGQRCSALRVLCVQEDAADRILEMLLGAMAQLRVGDPSRLSTDVGPVIDGEARDNIERHINNMQLRGRRVHQVAAVHGGQSLDQGTFVLPTLIEINGIGELQREVFGPVLHFVRYRRDDLDSLVAQINATGYGLTMGLHTRIDETIAKVVSAVHAGNIYVNRNMVGAVVGVQPFGGEGLSGTGPKAGGPLYLYRLLSQCPDDVLCRALASRANVSVPTEQTPFAQLQKWASARADKRVVNAASKFATQLPGQKAMTLPGPTGERNVYSIVPRTAALCLAEDDDDRLVQLSAVLAAGSRAIWPSTAAALWKQLPDAVKACVDMTDDPFANGVAFDAVLLHASLDELKSVQLKLARRQGAVVSVERLEPGDDAIALERLVIEKALSVNTAAAGGNATLMTIG